VEAGGSLGPEPQRLSRVLPELKGGEVVLIRVGTVRGSVASKYMT